MIKKYEKWIIVENKKDLYENKKEIIWEEDDCIRLGGYGCIYFGDVEKYPALFEYHAPFDAHCCGNYCYVKDTAKLEKEIEINKNYMDNFLKTIK